jgi:hypothetical protein
MVKELTAILNPIIVKEFVPREEVLLTKYSHRPEQYV